MIASGGRDAGISTTRRTILASFAIVLALALAPSQSAATTPADKAATDAYLRAQYEYQRAILAGATATRGSLLAFATSLERQCSGALAGAPETEGPLTPGALNERQTGELARERDQRLAIELELGRGEFAVQELPNAPAAASLSAAIAPLRWSDSRIAASIAKRLAGEQRERQSIDATELCADMRSWSQSGFRKLATRTAELKSRLAGELESLAGGPPVETLLRPYEGPPERALIRRTQRLENVYFRGVFTQFESINKRLQAALGLKEPRGITETKQTVLGKGETKSGATFKVTAESPQRSGRAGCRREVSVEYTVSEPSTEHVVLETGSGGNVCVSGRAAVRMPRVACEDGRLTISEVLDPGVSRVRLKLADGRSLTSSVVRIPKRDGGPAGLYVQALGGRSSRPLSLTELDRNGVTVGTLEIPTHARCHRLRQHSAPAFVPLAQGTTPAGTTFKITGFGGTGPDSFNLAVSSGQDFGAEETIGGYPLKITFPWSLAQECAPQEWAVLYGVLKSPGASVAAVTATGEVPLATLAIPADLHAGGMLAYGAFTQIPSRLIVRDGGGQVIASEDLTSRITEHREYCEGYAES